MGATLLYLGAVVFRDYLLVRCLGIPSTLTSEYFAQSASTYFGANVLLRLPALLVIGLLLVQRRAGDGLRRALRPSKRDPLVGTVATVLVLSFLLNGLGLWPFSWRWPSDSTARIAHEVVSAGAWVALGWWIVLAAIATPIIEEIIFRYWLLKAVARTTRSARLAIGVSSLLFGVAHLGYWPIWHPDVQHLTNAAWLFAGSVALGHLTVRADGRLGVALAAHMTRNGCEVAVLLWAVTQAQ